MSGYKPVEKRDPLSPALQAVLLAIADGIDTTRDLEHEYGNNVGKVRSKCSVLSAAGLIRSVRVCTATLQVGQVCHWVLTDAGRKHVERLTIKARGVAA